jgi:rRNA-processing protein FCF1
MKPLYRIPRRFYYLFEEGRLFARLEREMNPDPRSAVIAELKKKRDERDRKAKIERTMRIAREYTAARKAAA